MSGFPFDGSLAGILMLVAILFCAGFVRGYSGFGSSAVIITALAPFASPSAIVPVTVLLEILASILMVRGTRGHLDWSVFRLVVIGALIGSPLGLAAHFYVSETTIKLLIQGFVLAFALALLAGWTLKRPPGPVGTLGVGALSGVANTAASLGGLPVALFFVAGNNSPNMLRATMVSFFFFVNAVSVALLLSAGIMTAESFKTLALWGLPVIIGVYAGGKHFLGASPQTFRRVVLSLLITLAVTGIARTIWDLI